MPVLFVMAEYVVWVSRKDAKYRKDAKRKIATSEFQPHQENPNR